MSDITIAPTQILSRICRCFACGSEHTNESNCNVVAPPPASVVAAAIEAVFWASLSTEEGKPVLAKIRFSAPGMDELRLDSKTLSATTLRKMSPFFDNRGNGLLVDGTGKIVGIGAMPRSSDLTHSHTLWLSANAPGVLSLGTGDHVLFIFEQGVWTPIGTTRDDVYEAATDLFFQEERTGKHPVLYEDQAASLVIGIAMRARRHRRGATFVALTNPSSTQGFEFFSQPVTSFDGLGKLHKTWLDLGLRSTTVPGTHVDKYRRELDRTQFEKLRREMLDTIDSGSGIDGATVIALSPTITVLAFGAKISARHTGVVEMMSLDGRHTTVNVSETGGMRHQSAAGLAHENKNARVVTVSQDGEVSIFAWQEKCQSLVWLRNLHLPFSGFLHELKGDA